MLSSSYHTNLLVDVASLQGTIVQVSQKGSKFGPETFLSKIFELKMLANLNFEGCIKQNCSFWKVAVLPRWFKTVETSAKYGLQCFPDPSCRSESLPRKTYGARNLGDSLFEGCTEQNHCFWNSQGLQNRFETMLT